MAVSMGAIIMTPPETCTLLTHELLLSGSPAFVREDGYAPADLLFKYNMLIWSMSISVMSLFP
jgi:hypothetical protein